METAIETSDIHRYITTNCRKRLLRLESGCWPTRDLMSDASIQIIMRKLSRHSGGRPRASSSPEQDELHGAYDRLEKILYPSEQDEPGIEKQSTLSDQLNDFALLPLMSNARSTKHRYYSGKIGGLNTLLQDLKRGAPFVAASHDVTSLFIMESLTSFGGDDATFLKEWELHIKDLELYGITRSQIAEAHKDLLRWQGQGEVAAQRPESVTQIYISVVESVIRRFEADRHLSTTEDAKDLLPDFRTWSRAWMGIEEKSNG